MTEDGDAVNPEEAGVAADTAEQVRAAVGRLPAVEGEAIRRKYLDGAFLYTKEARNAGARGLALLRRDSRIMALRDEGAGFLLYRGVTAFQSRRESAVEAVVLRRLRYSGQ